MKRRIEQLLNGKFEYETPQLKIQPEEIQIRLVPGEVIQKSFVLEHPKGEKVRGFLYSSNPRITCNPVEFQGTRNEIHYQVDGNGLPEGWVEDGAFTICSELGEYTLPYTVRAEKTREQGGRESSLDAAALAKLAEENFQQAYRQFISPGFGDYLKEKEPQLYGLYRGLGTPSFNYQSLEEFLTGTGRKEAVEISIDRNEIELSALSEPVRETIQITKSMTGFQKIKVEADGRFLRPEKKLITTDEFVGSTFDLNIVIDTNLMHGGRNYGRIKLSTCYQTIYIQVTARKAGKPAAQKQGHICKIMQKKLESLYVGFRLKKIDVQTWIDRSVSVINSYRRAGRNDPFAELFLVQLYYADGKRQKALKLLQGLEQSRRRLNTPERYGFFLYMTTFFNREKEYVDQVEEEIGRMFARDKTNWKLQWILFYLKESLLKDENARYEAAAEQFRYGCRSRILYLEAYPILKKNPFLMRHLGPFELQLLRFAAKEQILTAEVMRQAASLAMHHPEFDEQLFGILCRGSELYPSEDLIKAICLLLMKGDKKEHKYFEWYEKGVSYGLRITGLYEYYMESMEYTNLQDMPQIIRMYFAYDHTLDYKKRAAVYRRMTEKKEEDPQTYRNFRVAMEKFTLDQLEAGRITEDLCVLYRAYIRKNLLTKTMAERLTDLLFTLEVTCEAPSIRQVIAYSPRTGREQAVNFSEGRALVRCFDPETVLLVADQEGIRYTAAMLCESRQLFWEEQMLPWCMEKASEHPGLLLYVSSQCLLRGEINRESLPCLKKACETGGLTSEYKRKLQKAVLEWYKEHPGEETLREFLAEIPYQEYIEVDKKTLLTLLAQEGMCQEAFMLIDRYGAEEVPVLELVRICSRMVLDREFEENAMLVSLCHYCFSCGKYDDKLLRYLLLYYEGPVQSMMQIWQAGVKFELDTMLLEEKMMMMLLFTRNDTRGTEAVFESYARKMGRKKLCRAYVNLKAYEYFVKGQPVAESVFQYIERDYEKFRRQGRLQEQEDVCRLALMQHYAMTVTLTEEQKGYVEELLEEYSAKGMRFAFWKRFDDELLAPYQMKGREFVEYVGNPDSIVYISWRKKGQEEYTRETMKNCFEGIFVREFTLFYGDELECFLEEELDGSIKKSDKRILGASGEFTGENTRYELLNRISRAVRQNDEAAFHEEIGTYLQLEHLTKELFTLI